MAVAETVPVRGAAPVGAHHARFEGFHEGLEVGDAGGNERDGEDDFAEEDDAPDVVGEVEGSGGGF